MVRFAMQYLEELPKGHSLLHCLRSVAEGKIYLEQEYARLTIMLSKIKEEEGNPLEASNLLNEV
jgi:26S proteasome regulatory subunit N5